MNREIVIYVEGGGPGGTGRAAFRRGMSEFIKPVIARTGKKGVRWQVIARGGRRETYDAFAHALTENPECYNILLVDSEEAGADMNFPWKHLLNRKGDGWKRPVSATDEQCHMMVVCMEAWFLADPDGLVRHFGSHFDKSKLPPADRAENTGKDAICAALTKATKDTPAKEYKKIRDGAKLLGKIDPEKVKAHCAWCDRLFNTLEHLITT